MSTDYWQQQLEFFTSRIERVPSDPDNYLERGHFFLQHGQIDLAIIDYSMAIDLNPDRFESYNSRGVAYSEKAQFIQALYDLDQAVKLSPRTPIIYVNRGIVYCLNSNYEDGINDYNQAIHLWMDLSRFPQQKQRWRAYHNRGVAYRQLNRMRASLEDMIRALILAPDQRLLHLDLAKLYRHCGSRKLVPFFNGEISEEEICELPRLHHGLGLPQPDEQTLLRKYQALISIYVKTERNTLVTSLRTHSEQLLGDQKKNQTA